MAQPHNKPQNYANHVRWHPPHHFVFIPLTAALLGGSIYYSTQYPEDRMLWIAAALAFFMILFLGVMMRQHYALGNQNRIIRLEMRLRYFQVTGKRLEPLESALTFGRIAALRFAPDEELPGLVDQAIAEHLSADDIKKRIKNWLPDHMRR